MSEVDAAVAQAAAELSADGIEIEEVSGLPLALLQGDYSPN